VGVIATEATVRSDAYPQALRALRPDLAILSQACPLFVPLVEEGWHDDPVTEQVAERYLRPLLDAGIDTLVLGCTHYPLLVPVLKRVAGPDVTLVDSAESVAEMVASGLAESGLTATHPAVHHFCVTDAGESFQRLARMILRDGDVPLEWVEVV
jgi:glutamate racemase